MLIDTHSHIHDPQYGFDPQVIERALQAGVETMICVGTDPDDSAQALKFAASHSECVATVGLHPHEARAGKAALVKLNALITSSQVVGVGECGLDYFYGHSSRGAQEAALRYQIELALEHRKPLVFHVRDGKQSAFRDFFRIIADYSQIEGVIHSFSSDLGNLNLALERGLFIALNGIMTFTKNETQLAAAKAVPVDKLLLETDAPFLTPTPLRGKVNEPANVRKIAEFLADLRGESLEQIAKASTANAKHLFKL